MSHKKAKKIRQMFNREVKAQAAATVAHWGQMLRPKPRWCPAFVYRAALKLVLK